MKKRAVLIVLPVFLGIVMVLVKSAIQEKSARAERVAREKIQRDWQQFVATVRGNSSWQHRTFLTKPGDLAVL